MTYRASTCGCRFSYAPKDGMNTRGNHYLNVVARLKPGMRIERATTEMAGIAKQSSSNSRRTKASAQK